jgi:hypothetical protein
MTHSIVVLGDCIATGLSLLQPQIMNENIVKNEFDPKFWKEYEKKSIAWFLKNNNKIFELKNIRSETIKFRSEQEKKLSWPSYMPNTLNLAVQGETFQGMHKKIKKIITDGEKPSTVLITCFHPSHRCVVINHDNQKYVIKRDTHRLEYEQNIWPKKPYSKFVEKVKQQEIKGRSFQKRKNKKSFELLAKLLKLHNITYKFLVFRQSNMYITDQFVDMTDFLDSYTDRDKNEFLVKKQQVQKSIAKHILDHIAT